ncbi:hypothetical protein [Saccharothrix luteola]|uniref:hypothetical protein n=1 Tax=Saccharothrix luteola TaxID=2893018 RepID=UPI001E33FEA0|nr:hypothetical protein [Saccharothrix luteola]MCC8250505.1 hypothetical protein [Saccharothrix luteola]
MVAVLLWKFFYDASLIGVFNTVLGRVGLGPWQWLQNPGSAMPALVLEATSSHADLLAWHGRWSTLTDAGLHSRAGDLVDHPHRAVPGVPTAVPGHHRVRDYGEVMQEGLAKPSEQPSR